MMRAMLTVLIGCLAISCRDHVYDGTPCPLPVDPTYFTDVYPIINRSCALPGCHVNGFEKGNFKNEYDVQQLAKSGKLTSMIFTRQMPPGTTSGEPFLTECEIKIVDEWVRNGAQLN